MSLRIPSATRRKLISQPPLDERSLNRVEESNLYLCFDFKRTLLCKWQDSNLHGQLEWTASHFYLPESNGLHQLCVFRTYSPVLPPAISCWSMVMTSDLYSISVCQFRHTCLNNPPTSLSAGLLFAEH